MIYGLILGYFVVGPLLVLIVGFILSIKQINNDPTESSKSLMKTMRDNPVRIKE